MNPHPDTDFTLRFLDALNKHPNLHTIPKGTLFHETSQPPYITVNPTAKGRCIEITLALHLPTSSMAPLRALEKACLETLEKFASYKVYQPPTLTHHKNHQMVKTHYIRLLNGDPL